MLIPTTVLQLRYWKWRRMGKEGARMDEQSAVAASRIPHFSVSSSAAAISSCRADMDQRPTGTPSENYPPVICLANSSPSSAVTARSTVMLKTSAHSVEPCPYR